jgi:MFS transporter, MHS family, proline/betaine transporter
MKDKIASGLGSVLEWYDFALYGFFVQIISMVYFPDVSYEVRLIKTLSVFAVGFCARPIGGIIFGYIGDKYGRKTSLKITPLLITLPTILFAILPGYQNIGIMAPIALIVLRIFQGICIGGEYANNIVFLCESSKPKNRYFNGSLGSCASSLGICLAALTTKFCYTLFNYDDLINWAWRLPFCVSLFLGILVFYMRKNIAETQDFIKINNSMPLINPLIYSYKFQKKDYLLAFGVTVLPATSFYFVFVFLPNYISGILGGDFSNILGDNSIALCLRLLIIPAIGLVADKIGGIKIAQISCICFIFFTIPLMYNIVYLKNIIVPLYIFAFLTTLNAATTPGLLTNLLKPQTRCTILALISNVCFGIFGGIVPVISLILSEKINKIAPSFYLIFISIITLIATKFYEKRELANGI